MDTVTSEIAEAEFERFVDLMALDVDDSGLPPDEADAISKMKRVFVRAVMAGSLVVDESGQPIFTTGEGTNIVFHEPTGIAFLEMTQGKSGGEMARMNRFMAAITKMLPKTFANMPNRDLKIAQAITGLFMA